MYIITDEKIRFTEEEANLVRNFRSLIDELYEVTEDSGIEEACKKIMDTLYYLYEEKVER